MCACKSVPSLYHVCMQRPCAIAKASHRSAICVHAATRSLFYLHIQRTHMMAQTSNFKAALRNCSRVPP
jgi:hypothetical protein